MYIAPFEQAITVKMDGNTALSTSKRISRLIGSVPISISSATEEPIGNEADTDTTPGLDAITGVGYIHCAPRDVDYGLNVLTCPLGVSKWDGGMQSTMVL